MLLWRFVYFFLEILKNLLLYNFGLKFKILNSATFRHYLQKIRIYPLNLTLNNKNGLILRFFHNSILVPN